jgi:citrate synthase
MLRYRGIPIEERAERSAFVEAAYLLIWGKLPTYHELANLLTRNEMLHEDMKFHFEGFPPNAHPMAILSSMIANYKEIMDAPEGRIYRPRQIYRGPTESHYVPIGERR